VAPRDRPEQGGSERGSSASVKERVKERIGDTIASADQEARSRVELGRSELAEHVGSVAQVLQDVGKQLRDNQEDTIARYADRAGSGVQRLSEYLEQRDTQELLRDVKTFAKNHPGVFLGGAALVGFAMARFFKSSEPHQEEYSPGGIGGMRWQEGSSEGFTPRAQSGSAMPAGSAAVPAGGGPRSHAPYRPGAAGASAPSAGMSSTAMPSTGPSMPPAGPMPSGATGHQGASSSLEQSRSGASQYQPKTFEPREAGRQPPPQQPPPRGGGLR
jgi:hypothetical protein